MAATASKVGHHEDLHASLRHATKLTTARDAEIREFRSRMWSTVQERKHTVTKVFPARFDAGGAADVELMLYGKVEYKTKDGSESGASWGAHAVLKKVLDGEREEWKLAQYRVWIQK